MSTEDNDLLADYSLAEDDYYNPHDLLTRNGMWNFVVAGRGKGKTFAFKNLGIKNFLKKGEQFIYLRRWETELNEKGTFWDDIAAYYPKYEFRVNGMVGEMRVTCELGKDCKKHKWQTVCFFQALSKAGNVKSVPFPKVTMIVFDEIFANNRRYLPVEYEAFQEFYSTVDRWKDKTRVFFLSNSVELANPYFITYDIVPSGRMFQRYAHGYIIVEIVDGGKFALKVKRTRFGQFIRNQEYAKYAIDNQFRDDTDTLVVNDKRGNMSYAFTIETDIATMSFYVRFNDTMELNYHVVKHVPKNSIIYVTSPKRVTAEKKLVLKRDDLNRKVVNAYRNGLMTFESPQIRSAFFDYLKNNL